MACEVCGNGEHPEEVCPQKPSIVMVGAESMRVVAGSQLASKSFRDCRTQRRLALSQREEDPARVWLELVSVREHASKLPALAADDPLLLQDVERFRAKLEAEIFTLTEEVDDEVLAPLYAWVDLVRRRNTLDRDILSARQRVKEARIARRDSRRAPRTLEESAQQLDEGQALLDVCNAAIPPAPSDAELAVWRAEDSESRRATLPDSPDVIRARGVAARQLLAAPGAGARPGELGVNPYVGSATEIALVAASSIGGVIATCLVITLSLSGTSTTARLAPAALAALAWIALAVVLAVGWSARRRLRDERAAVVDAIWHFEHATESARAMDVEVGWIRVLLDGFKARRAFDESKAEGRQIEDLKQWRPDLRDFVVEVAMQGDAAAAAAAAAVDNSGNVESVWP